MNKTWLLGAAINVFVGVIGFFIAFNSVNPIIFMAGFLFGLINLAAGYRSVDKALHPKT